MNVNPGELNKKIQIVGSEKIEDEYGCESEKEVIIRTCFAKFTRVSGTEKVKSGADMEEVKVRFLVRYSTVEITRKMRVLYSGDYYEIKYINPYEDSKEYIEIWGELITNGTV